jgi:hypothetical protein
MIYKYRESFENTKIKNNWETFVPRPMPKPVVIESRSARPIFPTFEGPENNPKLLEAKKVDLEIPEVKTMDGGDIYLFRQNIQPKEKRKEVKYSR